MVASQGARSDVWSFQMSGEQRGIAAIRRATLRDDSYFSAILRSSSLVWNDHTALAAPCLAEK
jgi:hypothetical protein